MHRRRYIYSITLWVLIAFASQTIAVSEAASSSGNAFLPKPGTLVGLSSSFQPAALKGIKVIPDNPLQLEFIVDQGQNSTVAKEQAETLVKYFLAAMTTPEKDMWVNLSPFEQSRIVPEYFGQTEMGRDLLAQDYLLKQITASLMYPEDAVGKKFWERVYAESAKRYGHTTAPINTFNKVWIVPSKALVYENDKAGTAYVVESSLKVLLESDYLSTAKHQAPADPVGQSIVREVILPLLEKEVNEGKNFAQLRQIYNSLILAAWYKKKIKTSILSAVYQDKNKVTGIAVEDPQEKEKIYARYLEAFKKGAYNLVREEEDVVTKVRVPRKYFSGGAQFGNIERAMISTSKLSDDLSVEHLATMKLRLESLSDAAMSSSIERLTQQYVINAQSVDNTPILLTAEDDSDIQRLKTALKKIGFAEGDPRKTTEELKSDPNFPQAFFYTITPKTWPLIRAKGWESVGEHGRAQVFIIEGSLNLAGSLPQPQRTELRRQIAVIRAEKFIGTSMTFMEAGAAARKQVEEDFEEKELERLRELLSLEDPIIPKSLSDDPAWETMTEIEKIAELRRFQVDEAIREKGRVKAGTDGLTGLVRREIGESQFAKEINRLLKRTKKPVNGAVLFIDIDRFKAINDIFGHEMGDLILKDTASVLKNSLRATDVVMRYGGEEFVAFTNFDSADVENKKKMVERIQNQIPLRVDFGKAVRTVLGNGNLAAQVLRLDERSNRELIAQIIKNKISEIKASIEADKNEKADKGGKKLKNDIEDSLRLIENVALFQLAMQNDATIDQLREELHGLDDVVMALEGTKFRASTQMPYVFETWQVTVSVGAVMMNIPAGYSHPEFDPLSFLNALKILADQLLYVSKNNGRNRVTYYPPEGLPEVADPVDFVNNIPALPRELRTASQAMISQGDDRLNLADDENVVGGIDLNTDRLDLNVQGDGIRLNVNPELLNQLKDTTGFIPVILNIRPTTDLRAFLGAQSI